ncbi:interactor of HORMAD1 protein 1 [Stegastes partitus]|uniref:Interactor of HORMAD1 protein 1 n=1 Tax=Stegastes partitus TaxID=144197 RepID=A0A9Y4MVI2_9TELE|nr:PREDICTED: coiled-coil domain-containing protein 36 [Stegastes partitus]
MNHIRNIKDMLSIPTGSRNGATSCYSTLTDSQLFFGSQFWPDNSQVASQDMSLSSRNSQQSSQEGSEPKFLSNYHTKPLLLGNLNDKTRICGIVDQFEEDRKKAKEKTDNDLLAKEYHHIRETLNNIQQLVLDTERNTAVSQTTSEKIDNFASTLQISLNSLQSDVSLQFDTLVNKVKSQKEVMTELEGRLQKNGEATAELESHLHGLKNSLESLREEQERERHMLEEALKLLNTLVSEHSAKSSAVEVTDSAIQTSPALKQSVSSNILQDDKLDGTQLACASNNLEQNQVEVPPQDHSRIIVKKKGRARPRKRPAVPSQKRKCRVSDENRPPLRAFNKQNVSTCLSDRCYLDTVSSQDSLNPDCLIPLNGEAVSSKAAGCFINPLNCWSQDSNSPVGLEGIELILEKLSPEMSTVKPASFWQLFEADLDL